MTTTLHKVLNDKHGHDAAAITIQPPMKGVKVVGGRDG
jgi:hypothetical protein